jgi:hypothetical protein
MNPLILLIVGAVGLAGCVILVGLGLTMMRQDRNGKDGTPREAAKPAGGNPFAGAAARLGGGSGAPRGSAHEVLRVMRDNLTGRLSLEIAGERYASLDEMPEGEMRQAVMTTLGDLSAFAGEAAPEALAAPQPPAAGKPEPAASKPAPAAEYKPLPPPTMNPFRQMAVMRELAKNPPPAPKTIMEQIDEVLQERIVGTPLIHRGLHVRSDTRGDAQFEADGQTYGSVDEVPDVEVRDAIKGAIAQWETKQ